MLPNFRVGRQMEVDGIVSSYGYYEYDDDIGNTVHWAPMFTVKSDHGPENRDECTPYLDLVMTKEDIESSEFIDCQYSGDGMSWKKGEPIVRFTSEGLQVSG